MMFILAVLIAVGSFFWWNAARKKSTEQHNPVYRSASQAALVIFLLCAVIALMECFVVIPAGNVGIVDVFGSVSENTLKAGINAVNPFARVVKMSVKTQEMKEVMDVPSREGLTVELEVSVLYHLNPDKAAEIYKTVGESYATIILEPQFRSVSRGVTSAYDARALYTSERELLAMQVQKELQALVEPRGITIESSPLRRVGLPPKLMESIEEKLRSEQESQRMQFVLTKEKQVADRKRIEAQGIADFQAIVTKGISEPLLRWKGIEATEKISQSQNTKVIIIGSGKDGLPLILDTK